VNRHPFLIYNAITMTHVNIHGCREPDVQCRSLYECSAAVAGNGCENPEHRMLRQFIVAWKDLVRIGLNNRNGYPRYACFLIINPDRILVRCPDIRSAPMDNITAYGMRFIPFLLFMLALQLPAFAEDRELAELFRSKGAEGTMVIRSLHSRKSYVHNDLRANRKVSPASTFKICNTLIALEEKAVTEENNLLKWDGTRYDFSDWNRDQTLESAFRLSCVWYYREIARRVGAVKYRRYLDGAGYGRLREPFDTTAFWLDGSLVVSPFGQAEFLEKVYRRTLPFSISSYEKLADIMINEKGPGYTIRAKTGWAARMEPQIGWFVGYVETAGDVWFFAMNIDIRTAADLPLRKELVLEALKIKRIIR
jgi:beta-lactamase class D